MPTPTTPVVLVVVLFPFEKPTIVTKAAARYRPLLGQLNELEKKTGTKIMIPTRNRAIYKWRSSCLVAVVAVAVAVVV